MPVRSVSFGLGRHRSTWVDRRTMRCSRCNASCTGSPRKMPDSPAPAPAPDILRMSNIFGATSTADQVLSGVDLRGKRILVTGVSAGIGVETARALAAHGAHVIGAVRDLIK